MKGICLSVFTAFLLVSCDNYQQIGQESPDRNKVESGQKFKIVLPENHTTGYMWQLKQDFETKNIDYIKSVFHGNEKGVYYHFIAGDKGTATLKFALIKYHDTTDVKTFIIDIQ